MKKPLEPFIWKEMLHPKWLNFNLQQTVYMKMCGNSTEHNLRSPLNPNVLWRWPLPEKTHCLAGGGHIWVIIDDLWCPITADCCAIDCNHFVVLYLGSFMYVHLVEILTPGTLGNTSSSCLDVNSENTAQPFQYALHWRMLGICSTTTALSVTCHVKEGAVAKP